MTVLYWFVRVNVEYENSEHNCGSKIFPAEKPKFVGFVSSHLLNTITKSGKNILNEVILNSNRVCSLTIPFCSKHPSNCNSLKEANPEKGHSRAAIKVHQLERVNATLKQSLFQTYVKVKSNLTFVTRGMPKQKRKVHRPMVKSLLCLRSLSGQLSTIPVTRASTLQNSLSMPSTNNITKKIVAQRTEPGRDRTKSG